MLPPTSTSSQVLTSLTPLPHFQVEEVFVSARGWVWQGLQMGLLPHHCLPISPNQENYSRNSITNLLDIMIQAKTNAESNTGGPDHNLKLLSDRHMLATVADIFGAGVETSASVVKWIVAFLLHYPLVSFLPQPSQPFLTPARLTSGYRGRGRAIPSGLL